MNLKSQSITIEREKKEDKKKDLMSSLAIILSAQPSMTDNIHVQGY